MGKRKRTDDSAATEEPDQKKQVTEPTKSTSAAERRQLRSERKSKKADQAKNNSQRKKKAATTGSAPQHVEQNENNDIFAGGNDFVPLNEVPSDQTDKIKKSSPHSQRKAAKVAKDKTSPQVASDKQDTSKSKQTKEGTRFICFVGNLPYSCTTDQIKHHFRKLEPSAIRHSTDKATGKSKGFAFLEFDDYSRMKTCLKVYHHSNFDPDRTSKLPEDAFDEHGLEKEDQSQATRKTGRKINVELTAGGGGKGQGRKDKITKKNTKLWEERERRKQTEMKQQKDKNKSKKDEKSEANRTEIGSEAVHPSRLKRVQHH